MAGIFCSSIGHDMNNLMSIILGKIHLLLATGGLDSGSQRNLNTVLNASEQLTELIHRMMTAGREHTPGRKERGDLSRITFDTVEFARTHSRIRTCIVTCAPGGVGCDG